MATKKTYFNRLWLTDSEFSAWVAPCKKSQTAYHCKLCEKSIWYQNRRMSSLAHGLSPKYWFNPRHKNLLRPKQIWHIPIRKCCFLNLLSAKQIWCHKLIRNFPVSVQFSHNLFGLVVWQYSYFLDYFIYLFVFVRYLKCSTETVRYVKSMGP